MDHESGLVFHAMASDLIPDQPLKGVSASCAFGGFKFAEIDACVARWGEAGPFCRRCLLAVFQRLTTKSCPQGPEMHKKGNKALLKPHPIMPVFGYLRLAPLPHPQVAHMAMEPPTVP